ncbi:SETMR methyltransferase, partial [Acromyrmex charruanus]
MEKNEFRAMIKHLHMKSLTLEEIKAESDNVQSTSAPAFATVYNWVNEFKCGRTSTCDAPRSGCPIEATDKVHDIVLIDRRVKVRATDISYDTVILILHEQLDEFLRRFITVDETWIHYFTSETKEQSKQWTSPSEPEEGEDRVMVTVFWDARGILLNRFNNILPHLAKKKVFFHQDNARVHTCPALMVKFNEFRYELFPYPAYSLDLAPCDYFLFPNLKKWFGGKRFTTREQLIAERESSSIELKGDYVEK